MREKHSLFKEIIARIVRKYQPEKIILFGSFAWGKPNRDSDIDLLIIKKTKKRFLDRLFKVRNIVDGEIPLDVLVHTPKEIEKRLKLGDFFYREILERGKVLYEKPKK